ncbi:putative mediator of RNA polymerase II transcription subunit 21 isoform X3 [Bradysia coprophila]|uniref:putative mediator of RNA polymerase II transcription subunit 21 isoform X3 n=1 Tax=Bradysia coprophila TaxID=38358 RepID=UPI00187D89B6|nr:putative mediator of RNA polymerase II transcription subunit 21 isoform X3 [Bradysia coprophila]
MKDFFIFGIVLQLTAVTLAQRVAPGVNPQHYQQNQQYQQQPPQANPQYQQQQQYQQPPQHQQQPPQHQQQQQQQQQQQGYQPQQAPVQHQQQQQQQQVHHQQQQGQAHGHGHGHGHGAPVLSGNVQEEKEHIQEHMEVPMDTSKMSEQELQFHYFKMHDADNNNKLDGCELIKSLIHWHDEKEQQNPEITFLSDEELSESVDAAFGIFDKDNDGVISYYEYRQQHAQEAIENQQAQAP